MPLSSNRWMANAIQGSLFEGITMHSGFPRVHRIQPVKARFLRENPQELRHGYIISGT